MPQTPSNSKVRSDSEDVSVALPVLGDGSGRSLSMGRRRAIVLAIVQLLIIIHVVIWVLSQEYGWFGGATITPIEPSEGMEFGKNGVINAGLIFFVLALASTLVFGRWFCGWGCHVVLLQDLCLWLLRRVHVRPRAFRSRFLLWAPLILAVYMFLWPAFYRFVLAPFIQPNLGWPGFSVHLTTQDFWATFPGVSIAIVFLFICGFATVYFLGAKGFCTYGCPYGGFFAPLDRFAPGSIRVTDDCHQCGKCTAGCTSNVRVHDEVRTWGMVTDPGCMKTMDCVDNCPNDALYFGFGTSAATTMKSSPRAEPVHRKWDLSTGEEWSFALICLLAFLAFRGAYGAVPVLMAIGAASIMTFLIWKFWRVLKDANVNLHRWQLKFHGRVKQPGAIFLVLVGALIIFTVQTGVVNWIGWGAMRSGHALRVTVASDQPMGEADRARAMATVGWLDRVSGFDRGGLGIATDPNHDLEAARLLAVLGDHAAAQTRLQPVITLFPDDLAVRRFELQLVMLQLSPEQVDIHVGAIEASAEVQQRLRLDVAQWHLASGRVGTAEAFIRPMVETDPPSMEAMKLLAVLLVNTDRVEEGRILIDRYLQRVPNDAHAWVTLAQVLVNANERAEADVAMETAIEVAGDDPTVLAEAARYYRATGRDARAYELELRLQRLVGSG
ncbi:MAG: 4Fe-4S binding protein [Phycisphaerales bacterium]|nr:4Fe-4S binding protein [Phycisphaerales bacterium]